MSTRSRRCPPVLVAASFALLLAGPVAAFDDLIDSPMYRSPELPAPVVVTVFPKGLKELWLQALKRPETEMRVRAADAITLAHDRGLQGLEATAGALVAALEQPDEPPATRLAAARGLIALDARQSAANLFAQLPSADIELRNLIEPALARWDHRPARAVWLDRLQKHGTPARSLVLAIQGLAAVKEDQAVSRLRELLMSSTTAPPIRLEAAHALGAIRAEGLVPDADKLVAQGKEHGMTERLAAAHLLQRHRDPAAVALLQPLLHDPEPAVAVLAGGRLLALDAHLLVGSVARLADSADAGVRALAVDVLFAVPTGPHLRMLSDRLADAHLGVRRKARASLLKLAAQAEHQRQIIDDSMRVLGGADWRGLEQAMILLTELDHKAAAQRCVALLQSSRPEVFVTAAWALRRLAVADTLEPVLGHVRKEFTRVAGGALPGPFNQELEAVDHKLSQLNQLLGTQKYAAAEPVLRQFVPKRTTPGPESRAAAIWALGWLHEDRADAKLALELAARVEDRGIPPEDPRVCRMSAITIGRMKAVEGLPTLRQFWTGRASGGMIEDACGWAIAHVNGEAFQAPEPIQRVQRDWFLLPETR